MKLIAKGAEASLFRDGEVLVKERLEKKYRIESLDKKLRKKRTKKEAKVLQKARKIISVPEVLETNLKEYEIKMEFISGKLLKNFLEKCSQKEVKGISKKIGSSIAKLHQKNIIHNDLTTSNLLLKEGEVYFIDFGLAVHSTRIEDKAMDLVVLKKAILATHPKKFSLLWEGILQGYAPSQKILKRIQKIEKRARYT